MNGIALQSVVTRAVGVLGALGGGFLLNAVGGPAVFFTGAAVIVVGALIVVSMARPNNRETRTDTPATRGSVVGDIRDGLQVMGGIRAVRALLAMTIVIEILAFSYMSVMPVVARDILGVGAVGLGVLTMMAGVGSLFGSLSLVVLSGYPHKVWLLLGASFFYGMGILAFSGSTWFPLSLAIVAGVWGVWRAPGGVDQFCGAVSPSTRITTTVWSSVCSLSWTNCLTSPKRWSMSSWERICRLPA